VAMLGANRPALYFAQFLEMGTSGLGTGAYMVLLLRLTQKRFSATQYALLSSLMSITRVFTGPPAGFLVEIFGWRDFFVLTLLAGVPGMVMLQRFVPWSMREPEFNVAPSTARTPMPRNALLGWAAAAGVVCLVLSVLAWSVSSAARSYSAGKVRLPVVELSPSSVSVKTRVVEGLGDFKTIREVVGRIPLDEFAGAALPAVGDTVTVVQQKTPAGEFVFSRRKALDRRFEPGPRARALLLPRSLDEVVNTFSLVLFSVLVAFATAATLAARRGVVGRDVGPLPQSTD
jgi:hypothetical protein